MKTPVVRKFLAGCMLLIGSVVPAVAQAQTPPPGALLDPKLAPKFDDVNISTPSAEDLKTCTVELVRGETPKTSGWLLKDGKGQPVRRFFDSTGTGKVDMWSYYRDGVEVYREFDTTGKGLPNNFRWINGGGMKWGIGAYDAKAAKWVIQSWRMISAEEVGFEAFQAVTKGDFARLESLFITEADLQALKVPAAKARAITATQQQAAAKFAKFVAGAKLAGVKFDGVEAGVPNCDVTLGDIEIFKHPTRAIRYSVNDKHGWIHTGEMIKVGMAWRLVDVPTGEGNPGGGIIAAQPRNDKLEKLLGDLAEHDKLSLTLPHVGLLAKNAKVDAFYSKRIDLINQIIPLEKEVDRENWRKQVFDNLSAQAQNSGDLPTMATLTRLRDDAVAEKPGSNLAAYGTYREMWTRYAVSTAIEKDDKKITALQDKWLDDLNAFTQKYPKADDTVEAMMQYATGSEFAGKLEQAKRAYDEFAKAYPDHGMTPRMRGSLARLNLVGSKLALTGPLLNEPTKAFNIADLKGKMVIVHYWATASSTYEADFAVLKQIMTQASKNNVELVCISLDDDAGKARQAIAKAQVPGIHLFQANNNAVGMNSPLAVQYGIHILPTTFMVNRTGEVTSNAIQINDIPTALK